jgi:hypothetical protein
LPAQLDVHPHTPGAPPPPHVSGVVQVLPAQHGCPFPPQFAHVVPHVVPAAHAMHATPPLPHAFGSLPSVQAFPLQHPVHDETSHAQTPATHRIPSAAQVPCTQIDAQPSFSPHALPAQLGVHVPVPQTFGAPPPPQDLPIAHPPQSTTCLHASRSWPHLSAHVSSRGTTQTLASPGAVDASADASGPASGSTETSKSPKIAPHPTKRSADEASRYGQIGVIAEEGVRVACRERPST